MSPDSRLKRLAFGFASLFLLIVGALLGVTQLYLMAVSVSLVPLAFWLFGYVLLNGLICERAMPSSCEKGERVRVELLLTNSTSFSKFFIRASDQLPRWVKFDGFDDESGTVLLSLRPGEQAKLAYYIRPYRRGRQAIGPTKVSNPDLLGLSNYSRKIGDTQDLLVYPEVTPVAVQFFNGGAAHGWMDQENAATSGTGTDFQGVREYQTGDDLRRVNWKTTARTGTLAVTEFSLGYVNDLAILLDLAPESYGDVKGNAGQAFETAVEIVASLAIAGLKQGSAVRIVTNGDLTALDQHMRGVPSCFLVLSELASVAQSANEPISNVVDRLTFSKDQGQLVIVVSGSGGFTQDLTQSLQSLRKSPAGQNPLVFNIDYADFQKQSTGRIQPRHPSVCRPAVVVESSVGQSIIIRSDTNLAELFSKSI